MQSCNHCSIGWLYDSLTTTKLCRIYCVYVVLKPILHAQLDCIREETLKGKCDASQRAWKQWKINGRPRDGDIYKASTLDVKHYVNTQRASEERTKLQNGDQIFKDRDPALFNIPKRKIQCRKLNVNGRSISDETDCLNCWRDHFSKLAQHNEHRLADVDVDGVYARSFRFEDQVFDIPFSIEEAECAVSMLKGGKSGGADVLQPEHIKFGGPSINAQLLGIFNAVTKIMSHYSSLQGKRPSSNSYCGITLLLSPNAWRLPLCVNSIDLL